ncbi:hypothetical protein J6590_080093 [Homalodisca vitripennis]|nr:hypothetical protein J6590_080093 [Homalodisca vitripennis]
MNPRIRTNILKLTCGGGRRFNARGSKDSAQSDLQIIQRDADNEYQTDDRSNQNGRSRWRQQFRLHRAELHALLNS